MIIETGRNDSLVDFVQYYKTADLHGAPLTPQSVRSPVISSYFQLFLRNTKPHREQQNPDKESSFSSKVQ